MRIAVPGRSVVGYVPINLGSNRLMKWDEVERCYRVQRDAYLLTYPNGHSAPIGVVGDDQAAEIGMAFHTYSFVKTVDGREGYLRSDDVFGEVPCGSEGPGS